MIDKLICIISFSGLLMVSGCTTNISMVESSDVYQTLDFGFAQAVHYKGVIYGSGQVGWDAHFELDNSLEGQLQQTAQNIESILEEVGSSWRDIIHLRFYVVDLNDASRKRIGDFLGDKYSAEYSPATTLLGVHRLARNDLKIEIEFIAKANKS